MIKYLSAIFFLVGVAAAAASSSGSSTHGSSEDEQIAQEFAHNTGSYEIILKKHYPSSTNPNFREFHHSQIGSGWKLHINADAKTADKIARLIVPILIAEKIPSKIITSHAILEKFALNTTQRGKFITIYPQSYKQAKELVSRFDPILKNSKLRAPTPLSGDAMIGFSGFVFIRYGEHGDVIPPNRFILQRARKEGVSILSQSGRRMPDKIPDRRSFPFPEFIWQQKNFDKDPIFFYRVPLRWTIPGTDLVLSLNNQKLHSWKQVIEMMEDPTFVQQHVKDHTEFNAFYTEITNAHPEMRSRRKLMQSSAGSESESDYSESDYSSSDLSSSFDGTPHHTPTPPRTKTPLRPLESMRLQPPPPVPPRPLSAFETARRKFTTPPAEVAPHRNENISRSNVTDLRRRFEVPSH